MAATAPGHAHPVAAVTDAAAILTELLERVEARKQPPPPEPRRGSQYYIRRNAHRTYMRYVHGRRVCVWN